MDTVKAQIIIKIITSLERVIIFVALFFCLGYMTKLLAGNTTKAEIMISLFAKLHVSGPIAVGISGVGYGYHERKLRKQHIRDTDVYIKQLEKYFNPGRGTSGLSEIGEQRKA